MKQIITFSFLIYLIGSISSCKKDEQDVKTPPSGEDPELITTVKLSFEDSAGIQSNSTAYFRDLDGSGGNAPSIFDTIRLKANTVYRLKLDFFNESIAPADTITNEILEEAANHLICFEASNANVTIQRTDSDGTYEIGLESLWTCGNSSNGSVLVTLRHQPGIKNGTCNLGESDIELNFVLYIE